MDSATINKIADAVVAKAERSLANRMQARGAVTDEDLMREVRKAIARKIAAKAR